VCYNIFTSENAEKYMRNTTEKKNEKNSEKDSKKRRRKE